MLCKSLCCSLYTRSCVNRQLCKHSEPFLLVLAPGGYSFCLAAAAAPCAHAGGSRPGTAASTPGRPPRTPGTPSAGLGIIAKHMDSFEVMDSPAVRAALAGMPQHQQQSGTAASSPAASPGGYVSVLRRFKSLVAACYALLVRATCSIRPLTATQTVAVCCTGAMNCCAVLC